VHTAEKCWSDASDAEKRTCGLGSRLVCSAVRRQSQTTNERRLAKWSVVGGLVVRLAKKAAALAQQASVTQERMKLGEDRVRRLGDAWNAEGSYE
jgi:hypothetical protein